MRPASCIASAIELLTEIVTYTSRPADLLANQFFRSRRYMGSKDRRRVASIVWGVMRSWRKLEWFLSSSECAPTVRLMVAFYLVCEDNIQLTRLIHYFDQTPYGAGALTSNEIAFLREAIAHRHHKSKAMPDSVRYELPQWLYDLFHQQWGERTNSELSVLRRQAPFDMRVNLLKTTRKALITRLRREGLAVEPTTISPWGLRLPVRHQVMSLPAYVGGEFEIQDEGSQLVAAACHVKAGMRVLDYCAGAGGKTLALAMMMHNKGQILACDVSRKRLEGAVRRARRAGVSNVQFLNWHHCEKKIKRKKGSFDCVLVDAPCSGTGTIRRNPDIAMRLNEEDLQEVVTKQFDLLQRAAAFVKEGGRLVYATCSLLDVENGKQIERFLKKFPSFHLVANASPSLPYALRKQALLNLTPAQHDTDGFFVAIMERSS